MMTTLPINSSMRFWGLWGAFFMFMAVALGAFGAHAMKKSIPPDLLAVFEVGVRYQVYHALGLFVVSWLATLQPHKFVSFAGGSFVIGIVIFSGSLYVLALTGIRSWGMITPIGGLAFLSGWTFLFISFLKRLF